MRKQQKHFTESLVGTWIMQLVLAIEFMHKKNVLHRDLKPQNLFVDEDMNLKIGDFGISKALESSLETCKTSIGTPCYMAPEMYTTDRYNNKADIWSLGCVVYEICALEKLFPMRDKEDKVVGIFKIMESIKEGRMREVPSIYSEGIRKLVK